ncbi:MAG: S41 family peptidase [Acidobacteriia bacterium]|nr:S41 family peptidase [Terriglobia bacterium]
MSEWIYAWLLRLYPSHFREAYGEEALQLFCDRARDEKGFLPSLRLWLDLLADLAVSLPGEYHRVSPSLHSASAQQRSDGTPSFQVLEARAPRLGALLLGGMLSLISLAATTDLISHTGSYRPRSFSVAQAQRSSYARSSALGRQARQPAGDSEEEALTSRHQREGADSSVPGDGNPESFEPGVLLLPGGSGMPQAQTAQSRPQGATGAIGEGEKLDAAGRHRVIERVIANLKEHYIYPDVAQKMAEALLAHEPSGENDAVTDGLAFASLLTRRLREVSHDLHLEVIYSQTRLPDHSTGPSGESLARYRKALEETHCTFEKVEILSHNIGYLKLNSFPDPSVCESTAKAAMASLNDAGAIIFDLRDNRGGHPGMVMLISAYLFNHPEYMYNPRENTTEQSWTRSPVPGNRLADKPVYVLTSARTFSAAEHFTYNLKMLKRATLVGETTGGATDVGIFHRIDDHFGMGIRETGGINPYATPDWAGTGVEPDVKVNAAEALETAEKLAASKLEKK